MIFIRSINEQNVGDSGGLAHWLVRGGTYFGDIWPLQMGRTPWKEYFIRTHTHRHFCNKQRAGFVVLRTTEEPGAQGPQIEGAIICVTYVTPINEQCVGWHQCLAHRSVLHSTPLAVTWSVGMDRTLYESCAVKRFTHTLVFAIKEEHTLWSFVRRKSKGTTLWR